MRFQLISKFSLEMINLYWDSLPCRGGPNFSLPINWKRIVQGIRGHQAEVRSQPWPDPPEELPFPLPWSADFAGSSKGR